MMKKILCLLIIPLFLTGCYDYQELNNRAVIAGIAIDYKEEEFFVDLEILNNKKGNGQEEESDKTYYVEGYGSTLTEAFQNCHLKLSKEPYYSHLKVLIIGEEVAQEKILDVLDYMIRDPSIRNIFLPVVAKGVDAKEILESVTTENPVVSTSIQSMIENNTANDSVSVIKDFESFLDTIIDPYQDAYINTITKNEDTLKINGVAAFKGNDLQTILNLEETIAFNTLNNDSTNYYVSMTCPNDEEKNITINLYQNKGTGFEFNENGILVKSSLHAMIIEDGCKFDFRKPEIYQKLNEEFATLIKKDYQKVIDLLKRNKTDILGINKAYYQKYRQPLENWYEQNFSYEISVNINKNGLIFEVNEND